MRKTGIYIVEAIGVLLALLWLAPFYLMFVNAFKTKKELFANTLSFPKSLYLDNFTIAADKLDILRTFGNSILITVISVCIIVFFSALAAYALQRTKSRISNIVFFLFIASMLVPFQSVMIPLVGFWGGMDMLNRGGIIIMYLGFGSSMSIFLFHGALGGISKSLDEAATIDGCNKWQTFWKIIFPCLKPMSVTVAILNTIWIWNDYLLPSLVINRPETQTIPLKMFFFFGEYTKQWHLALAGLTLAIVPVIIFYFFAQKQIIRGITQGSVKG